MLKARELRELTDEELDSKLHELKEELFSLRFKRTTGNISNPLRLRTIRKEIARIKTIQRERRNEKETKRQSN
ncbi:MAG TPA: 50S ribosomal protein L29 [bacterium (Candidatus Stahlbacteria)]|nr:50S ribosomal protein L29 [Candidatus Stahlbacteria bacterium]